MHFANKSWGRGRNSRDDNFAEKFRCCGLSDIKGGGLPRSLRGYPYHVYSAKKSFGQGSIRLRSSYQNATFLTHDQLGINVIRCNALSTFVESHILKEIYHHLLFIPDGGGDNNREFAQTESECAITAVPSLPAPPSLLLSALSLAFSLNESFTARAKCQFGPSTDPRLPRSCGRVAGCKGRLPPSVSPSL